MRFIKEFRRDNGSWVDDGIVYADSVEEAIKMSSDGWSEDFQQRLIVEIVYVKPTPAPGWQVAE